MINFSALRFSSDIPTTGQIRDGGGTTGTSTDGTPAGITINRFSGTDAFVNSGVRFGQDPHPQAPVEKKPLAKSPVVNKSNPHKDQGSEEWIG